eukprot:TRINITY_DN6016_c0_g2_i1.p1 TRINITY_DN6016_c0_g2~~TRINITY_DN6016_c0_g2_i1.p1  ORF type:complete len:349 (-),score=46.94 TRINITY_DN6016_c0_g2_i1:120-1166(-)
MSGALTIAMQRCGRLAIPTLRVSTRIRPDSSHKAMDGGEALLGAAVAVLLINGKWVTKGEGKAGGGGVACDVKAPPPGICIRGPEGFYDKMREASRAHISEVLSKTPPPDSQRYVALRLGALATSVAIPVVNHNSGSNSLDNFNSVLLYLGCGFIFAYAAKAELSNAFRKLHLSQEVANFPEERLPLETHTAVRAVFDTMIQSGDTMRNFPVSLRISNVQWECLSGPKFSAEFTVTYARPPPAIDLRVGESKRSILLEEEAKGKVTFEVRADDSLAVRSFYIALYARDANIKSLEQDGRLVLCFEPVCAGKVVQRLQLMRTNAFVVLEAGRLFQKDIVSPDASDCKLE